MAKTFQEQMDFSNKCNMFSTFNNVYIVELDEKHSLIRSELTDNSMNAMGGIHGAFLYLMGDRAAGMLARSIGGTFVTLDSTFRFLRDGRDAKVLVAEGSIIKRGRTITIVRAQVKVENTDTILAEGEFIFFCIDKK